MLIPINVILLVMADCAVQTAGPRTGTQREGTPILGGGEDIVGWRKMML
jgi:hypothetical protein